MKRLSCCVFVSIAGVAQAHPHITSGPGFANTSGQRVTFGISHGCSGKDTVKITIHIPANIASVRGLYGPFGAPTAVKAGSPAAVTQVTWEKLAFEVGDNTYPEFSLRMRVADVPFTTIPFNITQTCRDATGDTVVAWDQPDDSTGRAAPRLVVVPPRVPGWNKYTLTTSIVAADLPTYFGDAQIVWKGAAAYTANPAVAALIAMTPGVTALASDLVAGDEIWVKY